MNHWPINDDNNVIEIFKKLIDYVNKYGIKNE